MTPMKAMLLSFLDMVSIGATLTTLHTQPFIIFLVPFLKKIVVDPYPPVKEKAMDALLIFMSKFNYQSVVPPKYVFPSLLTIVF